MYPLACSVCSAAGVRGTGQELHKQINGHYADIMAMHNMPVAEHCDFSQPGHTLQVSGLQLAKDDTLLSGEGLDSFSAFLVLVQVF